MPGYSADDVRILTRFGTIIKSEREALGLSQEELAERASLHRTYIGGIEQGRRNVSLLNIIKVAHALGKRPEVLFERLT